MTEQKLSEAALNTPWAKRIRLIGTLLSLCLLIWLLYSQDWPTLLESLKGISPFSFLLAALCALTAQFFNATRWWALLRGQEIKPELGRLLQLSFAGLFASNFLPGTVGGDVARVAGILPYSRSKVAGAASVIMDRLIGVFGMAFVLPFSYPLIKLLLTSRDFLASGSIFTAALFFHLYRYHGAR